MPGAAARKFPLIAKLDSKKERGGSTMPRRGFVKNRKQYEGLRRRGMSKQRAAKITNAGKAGSRKGGRKSSQKRRRRSR
jgi:hypothetical protein